MAYQRHGVNLKPVELLRSHEARMALWESLEVGDVVVHRITGARGPVLHKIPSWGGAPASVHAILDDGTQVSDLDLINKEG